MTAREKLAIDHPQLIDETFWGGCVGCPDRHGYLTRPVFCKDKLYPSEANCANCWDREIPESKDCTTCSYADVPVDETPCKECDGSSKYQSKTIDKFNAIGNVQPIFPDEFKEGERKQMYNLCKIRTNENNGSVGGHPFDVIKRSESIDEIFTEIQKRVRDGCPTDKLKIMQDVKFTMSVNLELSEEKEA